MLAGELHQQGAQASGRVTHSDNSRVKDATGDFDPFLEDRVLTASAVLAV
jgi:hypothetical protein